MAELVVCKSGRRIIPVMEKVKQIAYYSFYLAVVVEVLMVIVDKSAYTNPIEGRLFLITFLVFTVKTALIKYSFK